MRSAQLPSTTLLSMLAHLVLKLLKTLATLFPSSLLCLGAQMLVVIFISTSTLPPQPHNSVIPRIQAHSVLLEDALQLF